MGDGRSRTFDVLGNVIKFLAYPDETEGKYCVMECIVPKGAGAPPNMHAGEMETFYVLDGEVAFHVDGEDILAKTGTFLNVPDGAVHAFSGVAQQSRLLILNAPGDMHEKFFTDIGVELPEGATQPLPPSGPPDVAALVAKASSLGMTILAPDAPS
jgi:quercetin dioxygenase-like cupin family protein